jgi:hypothetical protein
MVKRKPLGHPRYLAAKAYGDKSIVGKRKHLLMLGDEICKVRVLW